MARKRKSNQSTLSTICLTRQSLGLWSPDDKDSTSTLPTQSLQKLRREAWRAEPRERLRNELNSMRMESGPLLIQQESKEDRDAVKDVKSSISAQMSAK